MSVQTRTEKILCRFSHVPDCIRFLNRDRMRRMSRKSHAVFPVIISSLFPERIPCIKETIRRSIP